MSSKETQVHFMQVGPGGICFAHGPCKDSVGCPDHDCEEIIIAHGPNPEYVAMAEEWVRQNRRAYTQADVDKLVVEAEQRVWDAAIAQMPRSWLDNLLSGSESALRGKSGTWDCADIERLLRNIEARMEAAKSKAVGGQTDQQNS